MPDPRPRADAGRRLAVNGRLPPLAILARALTLSRIIGLPLFLWLLARVAAGPRPMAAAGLVLLYLVLALSDFVDGPLARRTGAADARWGWIDAAADVIFNLGSLTLAAYLGYVRGWVPAIVAVLGGRFLLQTGAGAGPPREDRPGKLAGVAYYALVGVIVAEIAIGIPGPALVLRAGDAVFLYSLFVLVRGVASRLVAPDVAAGT